MSQDLPFTYCEVGAITGVIMPKATVTERLRSRLRAWLREEGRGAAARIARYSQDSPGGSKILPQDLSYFLNPTSNKGRKGIQLDDLDDLAAATGLSIGELLSVTKKEELSAEEQRTVLAFRVLPPTLQEHFLAVIEQMSVGVRQGSGLHRGRLNRMIADSSARIPSSIPQVDTDGRALPVASDPSANSSDLRSLIDQLMLDLSKLSARLESRESSPSVRADESGHG